MQTISPYPHSLLTYPEAVLGIERCEPSEATELNVRQAEQPLRLAHA
jgi:hypothetical protein